MACYLIYLQQVTIFQGVVQMEFNEGDKVVYPRYGVGRVTGISKQKTGSNTETCLGISFEKRNMSLFIPVGRLGKVRLRKVMSRHAINKVMHTIRLRAHFSPGLTHKERVKFYQAKFDTGEPTEVAEVARDLARLSKKQELSMEEEALCRDSISLISTEIAVTKKKDMAPVRQDLEDILYR